MDTVKKRLWVYLVAGLVLVLLVGGLIAMTLNRTATPTVDDLLSLGEKYLLDLDYEQAVAQFLKVIEIEPMNERAYLGAAEAYVGLGQTDQAIEVLEEGLVALPDSEAIKAMLKKLMPKLPQQTTETENETESNSEPVNLTGKEPFALEDLEEWGFPLGMSALECLQKHGELFDSREVYVSGGGENYTYYEEPTSWVAEWVDEAKKEQDPHPGSGSVLVDRSDIYVSFYKNNQLINRVEIENGTLAGPRGVFTGMKAEDAINLFRCDNPDVLEYAKSQNRDVLPPPESTSDLASSWPLYEVQTRHNENEVDEFSMSHLSLYNDGRVELSYTVQLHDRGTSRYDNIAGLRLSIANGFISKIEIDYDYPD